MNNKHNFDFYRYNDLCTQALQYNTTEVEGTIIPYEESSLVASSILLSIQSFNEIENSPTVAKSGITSKAAVATWFLSIESFIARIIKILSVSSTIDFESTKSKDVNQKIIHACDALNIDSLKFKKTKLCSMLKEFKNLRNELFHAASFKKKLKMKHTAFTEHPTSINQVDVIQAADIAVTTMCMLRYTIKDVDIIPTYPLECKNLRSIKFFAIDEIYENLILKHFNKILDKHSLYSDFTPQDKTFYLQPSESKITTIPILKVTQDPQFIFQGNATKTEISKSLLSNFIKRNFTKEDKGSIKLYKAIN